MNEAEETITFRVPRDLKLRMVNETKRRGATLKTFMREAVEQELIRSARVRVGLVGTEIDLTGDDDS